MHTARTILACMLLLALTTPLRAEWCIEYTDFFVEIMRRAGSPVSKRVGRYRSLQECREAMAEAVTRSGDPSLAQHMTPVGFDDADPPPRRESSPLSPPARQETSFSRERDALLKHLKGTAGSRLELRSAPRLRLRRSPLPLPQPESHPDLERAIQTLEAEVRRIDGYVETFGMDRKPAFGTTP